MRSVRWPRRSLRHLRRRVPVLVAAVVALAAPATGCAPALLGAILATGASGGSSGGAPSAGVAPLASISVLIEQPTPGSSLRGAVEIVWSIKGPVDERDAVDLLLTSNTGGVPFYGPLGRVKASTRRFVWTTNQVPDGERYGLRLVPRTASGAEGTPADLAGTLTVDNTAPVVALSNPRSGDLVRGDLQLRWQTTDAHPKRARLLLRDGGGLAVSSTDLIDDGEHALDTTSLPDGAYSAVLTVEDAAGNPGDPDQASFVVDNTAPSIVLLAPADGAFVGASHEVRWQTQDANPHRVRITVEDGSGATAATFDVADTGTYRWNTTSLPEGSEYRVSLRAIDGAGSLSPATLAATVTVDRTRPVSTLLTCTGNEVLRGTVPIRWRTDDLHPARVEVRLSSDGGATFPTLLADVADTGSSAWSTATLPDGARYRVRVTATDAAGNAGAADASATDVTVDNTAPSLVLLSPAPGETLSGTVHIRWVTTDANPGTVDISLSDDSGTTFSHVIATAATDTGDLYWVSDGLPEGGGYRFRLASTDAAGNAGVAVVSPADHRIERYDTRIGWAKFSESGGVDAVSEHPDGGAYVGGSMGQAGILLGPGEAGQIQLTGTSGTSSGWSARLRADGTLAWAKGEGVGTVHDVATLGEHCLVAGSAPAIDERGFVLCRRASDGAIEWTRSVASSGLYSRVSSIGTTADGSIFVGGQFRGTVDIGTGPIASGSIDAGFVARFAADGSPSWIRVVDSPTSRQVLLDGVCVTSDGLLVAAGRFSETVSISDDTSSPTLVTAGAYDVWIAAWSPAGDLRWLKRQGGTSSEWAWDLCAAPEGDIYVTGQFGGGIAPTTSVFGPGEPGQVTFSGQLPEAGLFLARIRGDGTLAWATRVGSTFASPLGRCVGTLADGSAIVGGMFQSNATFGSGESGERTVTSLGGSTAFVARFRTDGDFSWVKLFDAASQINDNAQGVATWGDGSFIVVGTTTSPALISAGDPDEVIFTGAPTASFFVKYVR